MNWINIKELEQINELKEFSKQKAVVLFKNSPRCFISKFALKNFQNDFSNPTNTNCYMVDVVANRALSQQIAADFDIVHQSPQLLIVFDQKVVYHTSHEGIDANEVEKMLLRI